jgi:hypothetical protein
MHALLTNPLFGHNSVNNEPGAASSPTARILRLFDQAVAKGMMTVDYARVLLKENKRLIMVSSALDVQECLGVSQAGTKVLRWLVSSGATNDLSFLRDEAFAAILIEHLVAEDLQEVVWAWVKTSLERVPELSKLEGRAATQARREIVTPLLQLVIAEAKTVASLDKAYMCLSRAAGYLNGVSSETMIKIFQPLGRFLLNETISGQATRITSSASDYESFLSLLPVMFPLRKIDLYTAHLHLFHPTNPEPNLAMHFLKNSDRHDKHDSTVLGQTQEVVQLGLDTAKYLLENDRVHEALDIMDLLRIRFPTQLGVSRRQQLAEVKAEASTMELLNGLSLA